MMTPNNNMIDISSEGTGGSNLGRNSETGRDRDGDKRKNGSGKNSHFFRLNKTLGNKTMMIPSDKRF